MGKYTKVFNADEVEVKSPHKDSDSNIIDELEKISFKQPEAYYETTRTFSINSDPYGDMIRREIKKKHAELEEILHKKKKTSLDDYLEVFNELEEKDIGDIYLTGSVALFLQGKLDRTEFKDLDIAVLGEFQLDDDIKDFKRGDYPPDPNGTVRRSVKYEGIPIDLFKIKGINRVDVEYEGKTYRCQNYKDIIMAKINMAFEKLKDKDYLIDKGIIDIKIL